MSQYYINVQSRGYIHWQIFCCCFWTMHKFSYSYCFCSFVLDYLLNMSVEDQFCLAEDYSSHVCAPILLYVTVSPLLLYSVHLFRIYVVMLVNECYLTLEVHSRISKTFALRTLQFLFKMYLTCIFIYFCRML